jgi:hypothetical protein
VYQPHDCVLANFCLAPATREQRSSVPDVSMPKKKKAKVMDDMEADYEMIANPCVDIFDLDDDTAVGLPLLGRCSMC